MIQQEIFRRGGVKLTGINKFRGLYAGRAAVICCSGTTLEEYDDSFTPKAFLRFAVNEAIRRLEDRADFWVLSDDEIVHEYGHMCPQKTKILCMHEATKIVSRKCASVEEIYTVDSMARIRDYDNGFQFFSRGTVLIGAVEMARFMGIRDFYVFGLDCYRLKDRYYYDGRRPVSFTENRTDNRVYVNLKHRSAPRIFVTPKLRRMIEKLDEVKASGLWRDINIYCVNSKWSQQNAIEKITYHEFDRRVSHVDTPIQEDDVDDSPVATLPEKVTKNTALPDPERVEHLESIENFSCKQKKEKPPKKEFRGRPKGVNVSKKEWESTVSKLHDLRGMAVDFASQGLQDRITAVLKRIRSRSAHNEMLSIINLLQQDETGAEEDRAQL